MKLFEENKYTCSFTPTAERIPIDYEELYSIYGYDVEDDVSELRKAIDDFCECYLPKYYDEFDKINIELIRLIKNLKENGFEDFQFTSVLAKQVLINLGIIPSELEFKTFPLNVIEEFKLYGFRNKLNITLLFSPIFSIILGIYGAQPLRCSNER